jgi:hypothetical protein
MCATSSVYRGVLRQAEIIIIIKDCKNLYVNQSLSETSQLFCKSLISETGSGRFCEEK